MKLFLFVFVLTSSIINASNAPYTSSKVLIEKTLGELEQYFKRICKVSDWQNLTKCYQTLSEANNKGTVLEMLSNSSKSTSELGNYHQCIKSSSFLYYLLTYDELPGTNKTYLFLNQSSYYFGVCIHSECSDFIKDLISYKPQLMSYFALSNFTFISKEKGYQSDRAIILLIIFIIIVVILGIKLLFTFFFTCCCSNSLGILDKTDESFEEAGGEIDPLNSDNPRTSTQSKLTSTTHIIPSKTKTTAELIEEQKLLRKQMLKQLWVSFFNVLSNLKDVYSVKNNYYNDRKIQFLALIRATVLFFYVYNQNFLSSLQLTTKNIYKTNYYIFNRIGFLKVSSFALNVWVSLEGFECAFKLMTYLKKNISNLSFVTYLKFYVLFLPKAITFYVLFYFLHYSFSGFMSYSLFNPPFLSHLIQIMNNCDCISKPWKIFAFWEWLLIENPDARYRNSPCFVLANVFYNTHFCFIFFLLFMYLSFKIRKKLFDLLLFLIYFGLLVSSYFCCSEKYEAIDLFFVLGENCSMKLPHMFLVEYLAGVFGGVMYFYFIDIINSNSIQEEIDYIPLWFCNTLMRHFYRIPLIAKRILMIVLLALLFFISFISGFAFMSRDQEETDRSINAFFSVYLHYEKKLFNLVLVLIILFFQTKEISVVKYLYEFKVFTLLSRISFTYLCTITPLIYLYYTGFNMELNMNSDDFFFMTCGITFMLFLINLVLYLAIEQPCRLLIKNIKLSQKDKENAKLE